MSTLRRTAVGRWAVGALAATLLLAACTRSSDSGTGTTTTTAPPPPLAVGVDDTGRITVSADGRTVLTSSTGTGRNAPVAWRTAPYDVRSKQEGGAYLGHELLRTPPDTEIPWVTPSGAVGSPAAQQQTAVLGSGDREATVSAEPAGAGITRITVRAPSTATQLSVSFACGADERFYGFGAQTWATQHRGQTIPIWVVEQGLGKVTPETPQPPPSLLGEPYDSYIPLPAFFTSQDYGVSYDGTRYGTFELCTPEHPDSWRLETWHNELSFFVFTGDDPKALVERYTGLEGRPFRMPPDWFFAPMNDAVRGQENVLRVANLIRANDIPSSVMWTEDWIGIGSQATGFRLSHDWDVSRTEYPDLEALTGALHQKGFRFLGYVSPFIPTDRTTPGGPATDANGNPIELQPHNQEKWREAVEGSFMFKRPDGEPYLMLTPPFVPPGGGALDVTNPAAVAWFQSYLAKAEAMGVDGSMTDFGEWVPYDAVFANGETGATMHNQYPVLWQQANREFWEKARPDGDWLFYVRSGFTGSPTQSPAFWGGDQNTTFDRLDGLASVISLGVNLGLGGFAFYGHDIAGYSAFALPGIANTPTTKELFLRWAAIGAYTPMMRTHHGSRYGENWSFEGGPNPAKPEEPLSDPGTISAWKRLATTHITLFPYQKAYARQAVERGLPIMRHPILVYPDDPVFARGVPDDPTWAAFEAVGRPSRESFQYFFGDELLVAPIVDEGATTRPVYLPEGQWIDIRSGERHVGPVTITASAEPGDIPVYAKAGALVPKLPDTVETLVPTDDIDVVDHLDVADQLVVDVYPGADGRFVLEDGTTLSLSSNTSGVLESARVANVDAELVTAPPAKAFVTPKTRDATIELRLAGGGNATLTITNAPIDRTYTIRVVG